VLLSSLTVPELNDDHAYVMIVADGMGGHERGDVASSLVSEEFAALARRSDFTIDDVAEVVQRANRIVREAGATGPSPFSFFPSSIGPSFSAPLLAST